MSKLIEEINREVCSKSARDCSNNIANQKNKEIQEQLKEKAQTKANKHVQSKIMRANLKHFQ